MDNRNVLVMHRYANRRRDEAGNKYFEVFWAVEVYQYFDEREAMRGAEILNESGIHVVALISDNEIPESAEVFDRV